MFALGHCFQSCLYCQSFSVISEGSVLCDRCIEEWRRLDIISAKQNDFLSRSLLIWGKNNPSAGDLIKRLKQRENLAAIKTNRHENLRFHFMAHKFWTQFYPHSSFSSSEIVFVPAPARNELEEDHASLFAMELARLFGSPLAKLLKRVTQEEQKGLSRYERNQSKLALRVDADLAKSRVSSRKIVFVDDVLVSGSTARAAYLALGKPEDFEVWTIAYRPLFSSASLAENSHS